MDTAIACHSPVRRRSQTTSNSHPSRPVHAIAPPTFEGQRDAPRAREPTQLSALILELACPASSARSGASRSASGTCDLDLAMSLGLSTVAASDPPARRGGDGGSRASQGDFAASRGGLSLGWRAAVRETESDACSRLASGLVGATLPPHVESWRWLALCGPSCEPLARLRDSYSQEVTV